MLSIFSCACWPSVSSLENCLFRSSALLSSSFYFLQRSLGDFHLCLCLGLTDLISTPPFHKRRNKWLRSYIGYRTKIRTRSALRVKTSLIQPPYLINFPSFQKIITIWIVMNLSPIEVCCGSENKRSHLPDPPNSIPAPVFSCYSSVPEHTHLLFPLRLSRMKLLMCDCFYKVQNGNFTWFNLRSCSTFVAASLQTSAECCIWRLFSEVTSLYRWPVSNFHLSPLQALESTAALQDPSPGALHLPCVAHPSGPSPCPTALWTLPWLPRLRWCPCSYQPLTASANYSPLN